jgi:serine/threonine protein kinase/HD-like signal output (HDOD) protein
VLSLLGEGGMGRVYLAEHVLIGRRAAIKVLAADIASKEDLVSRFFTEARAVNDIRHPNIVEVTDFGTFGNQPYIVMELLDGETLEQRLLRVGTLDPAATVRVVAQVAAAVGAGHDHDMVHRDLKPANIFLRDHPDYPDFVKVLDFGIAKLVARDRNVQHHTEMGAIIGTPAYMSPEQCLGDTHLDYRSDIYSLGVVLYQMATGRLPFTAETAGRLIMSHVQETPPPPQSINPTISPATSAIILRAMAKKPEQRFTSMREFRDAILLTASTFASGASGRGPRDNLSPLLTPPPVSATAAPIVATMLATAPTSYSSSLTPAAPPTPMVAPNTSLFQSARLPVVAAASQAAVTTAPPLQNLTSPSFSATTASGKSALVDRLVEIVRSHTAPDADLDLPLMPRSILRCLDLLEAPDFSFGGMAALLAADARLASQLVQVASTSGPTRAPARSTEQAIARLGAEGVRTGLFEIALHPVLDAASPRLQAICKQPWPHALAVAILSQRLMQAHGASERVALDAYRSGLFHDCGKPIVVTLLIEIEKQMTNVKGRRVITDDMLVTCVDRTHASAGARLGRAWGLTPEAANAIDEATRPGQTHFSLGAVLRLANALAYKGGFHTRRDELDRARLLVDDARREAGFDEETCHRVLDGVKDIVSRRL